MIDPAIGGVGRGVGMYHFLYPDHCLDPLADAAETSRAASRQDRSADAGTVHDFRDIDGKAGGIGMKLEP